MSDRKKATRPTKATPVPSAVAPVTPKRDTDAPEPFVVREVTQPGRAFTIVGTGAPTKPSRR